MRPLLNFVAVFKNEDMCVKRTLDSVLPWIDRYTILDTGSTDGTQDIVREVMAGLPGNLWEEPFVDFAASRNRALELDALDSAFASQGSARIRRPEDQQAVFTLMLSSDEVLENGAELRAFLETQRDAADGAYSLEMKAGSQSWLYPRIFRTGAGWRYVGKVHEIPVGPQGQTTCPPSPARVIHTVSDPARRAKRIREFDFPTLTAMAGDESYSLAERAQPIFFLAEANTTLASECPKDENGQFEAGGPWLSYQMAAMALYWRCAQLMEASESPAHDHDKAMYCYFFYFHIAEKIGFYAPEEMMARLEAIAAHAPNLPEVHWLLAKTAAQVDSRKGLFFAERAVKVAREVRGKPSHLPTDGTLEWRSLWVAAECARHGKNEKYALELAREGLAAGGPKEAFAAYTAACDAARTAAESIS